MFPGAPAIKKRLRGAANRWSDVDLLVVMEEVADKRRAAVAMSRVLADLPVSKDIIVTTKSQDFPNRHIWWHYSHFPARSQHRNWFALHCPPVLRSLPLRQSCSCCGEVDVSICATSSGV